MHIRTEVTYLICLALAKLQVNCLFEPTVNKMNCHVFMFSLISDFQRSEIFLISFGLSFSYIIWLYFFWLIITACWPVWGYFMSKGWHTSVFVYILVFSGVSWEAFFLTMFICYQIYLFDTNNFHKDSVLTVITTMAQSGPRSSCNKKYFSRSSEFKPNQNTFFRGVLIPLQRIQSAYYMHIPNPFARAGEIFLSGV